MPEQIPDSSLPALSANCSSSKPAQLRPPAAQNTPCKDAKPEASTPPLSILKRKPSLWGVEMELLGAQGPHDRVEDTELQRREGTDHNTARAQALRAQLDDARLLGDVHHARRDGAISTSARLV